MIYGSVCSGVEAATVAWHGLGWDPAWFCEFDAFPSAVLDYHYPNIPNLGDMTQIECERLQGFPDNWTQIPWRGKDPENCPDGPRYKAMGNSMAVPVMHWIGRRIDMVDKLL